jgi:hypothetical protein
MKWGCRPAAPMAPSYHESIPGSFHIRKVAADPRLLSAWEAKRNVQTMTAMALRVARTIRTRNERPEDGRDERREDGREVWLVGFVIVYQDIEDPTWVGPDHSPVQRHEPSPQRRSHSWQDRTSAVGHASSHP